MQGRVDIGAANGFDERGDHVVVLVAVAVIAQNGLAARFRACGFGDRDRFVARLLRLGGRDSGGGFEDGQRPAGVGTGDADDEVPGILGEGELPGQPAIGFDGTVEQIADRLVVERTQGEHERPRQQGRDDGERRVLRGRGHEHDEPVLHCGQQGVLLGLGEAVDLVEEQHRRAAVHLPFAAGVLDDLPYVLDAGGDGGEFDEGAARGVGDDMGQRGLSDSGRAPQDHRGGSCPVSPAGFDELVERGSGEGQVFLTDDLVEGPRTHPHSERVKGAARGGPGGTGEARTRCFLVRAVGEQIGFLAHQASASSSSGSKSTPASARWASVIGAGACVSGS